MVRSVLHHHGESEGLLTQTQSVCQDRSQPSVYWTITVKVKDYSRRHKVFVVRTEVINTQYIEQSGWKWRTTHTDTKCLLSEQKSTLSIPNNQGESKGLLTQTQSGCCLDRSQHSGPRSRDRTVFQPSWRVVWKRRKKHLPLTPGNRVVKWRRLCWPEGQSRFKPYFGSRSVGTGN